MSDEKHSLADKIDLLLEEEEAEALADRLEAMSAADAARELGATAKPPPELRALLEREGIPTRDAGDAGDAGEDRAPKNVVPIAAARKPAPSRLPWTVFLAAAVLLLGAAVVWRERAELLGIGGPIAQGPTSTAIVGTGAPADMHVYYRPEGVGAGSGPACSVLKWEGDVAYVLLSGTPTRADLFTPDEPVCARADRPTTTLPIEAGGVDVAPFVGKSVEVKAVLTERDGNLVMTIRHIEPSASPPP